MYVYNYSTYIWNSGLSSDYIMNYFDLPIYIYIYTYIYMYIDDQLIEIHHFSTYVYYMYT